MFNRKKSERIHANSAWRLNVVKANGKDVVNGKWDSKHSRDLVFNRSKQRTEAAVWTANTWYIKTFSTWYTQHTQADKCTNITKDTLYSLNHQILWYPNPQFTCHAMFISGLFFVMQMMMKDVETTDTTLLILVIIWWLCASSNVWQYYHTYFLSML